jgi:hypothetical protein
MARHAALGDPTVVKSRDRPLTRGVARVALSLSYDMIGGLTIGARIIVARGAFLRSPFKYSTNVAGLAFRGFVSTR